MRFIYKIIVISARGLSLKGHTKLDVFVNLTLNSTGSWKSKVQTEIKKSTGDCTWDQACELLVFSYECIRIFFSYIITFFVNYLSIAISNLFKQ